MKTCIFLLFLSLTITVSFSQDFGKLGSKWYYDSHNSISDYTVFESIKDTTLLGKSVHLIEIKSFSRYGPWHEGFMYVYQSGDTVYEYNVDSNNFHVLMRFDLNFGDTVSFSSYKNQSLTKHILTGSIQ